jgi:hypothetical protein
MAHGGLYDRGANDADWGYGHCTGAGYGGLNFWVGDWKVSDPERWHQLNFDNHGHVHAFEGTASDHGIEYSGVGKNEAGGDVLNRMDIGKEGGNRVKVWWRKSADSGKTSTTVYEAIYSPPDGTK